MYDFKTTAKYVSNWFLTPVNLVGRRAIKEKRKRKEGRKKGARNMTDVYEQSGFS